MCDSSRFICVSHVVMCHFWLLCQWCHNCVIVDPLKDHCDSAVIVDWVTISKYRSLSSSCDFVVCVCCGSTTVAYQYVPFLFYSICKLYKAHTDLYHLPYIWRMIYFRLWC